MASSLSSGWRRRRHPTDFVSFTACRGAHSSEHQGVDPVECFAELEEENIYELSSAEPVQTYAVAYWVHGPCRERIDAASMATSSAEATWTVSGR